ncbi:MAG TPA: ABC transporter permease subunit [Nevskiaceae bacterium]|nr:ABC transporter permease subunit [Nevskiaceae bacterium]
MGASWGRNSVVLAGALALALLVLPFISLVFTTPWSSLHLQGGDMRAVDASLRYSAVAIAIVVVLGTPMAWWLARSSFRGKVVVDALSLLPLLAPDLVIGLMLVMVFGPYSWAGRPLQHLGLTLTNTPQAFVLAQVYSAAPYYVLIARAAFEGVPKELEQIAATLGRGPWSVFWRVSVPLSGLGLAAGLALGWLRAIGEFGIIVIVAYFPQGIPVKLWTNLQDSGLSAVYPLTWLFFAVALPLPLLLGVVSRRYPIR